MPHLIQHSVTCKHYQTTVGGQRPLIQAHLITRQLASGYPLPRLCWETWVLDLRGLRASREHLQQLDDQVLATGVQQPDLELGVVGGRHRQRVRRAGAHRVAVGGRQRRHQHIHPAQLVQVCMRAGHCSNGFHADMEAFGRLQCAQPGRVEVFGWVT